MTRLSILGRLLPVLGLVAATLALGASSAEAQSFARACRNPDFVTSDPNGGTPMGRYYVHNNMWNVPPYHASETLKACSAGNWFVNAKMSNAKGAVKTYPNVHRDYNEPKLSSFTSIRSKFASRSPHVGIYNGAYDIWINGVADGGSTELMIWTDNYKQVPAGRVVRKGLEFSRRTWKLWATDDHRYLALVPNRPLKHGKIALKKRFAYLTSHGFLPRGSTLGQVCFGYEIVSTNGVFHKFKIDRFKVTSSRK